MGRALGTAEFAILQAHADAGDRIAYYSQLSDWGYNYGELALGVVTNDSLSGATANIFFLQNAGRAVSHNELATVSLNLMRLDLAARQAFAGSATGQELPVDAVQAYHATAFGLIGVSVDAWTPNFVLENLPNAAAREAYWDELLSSSAIGSWFETAQEALSPPTLASALYLGELTATGALALTAQSGDYGAFSISLGNADGGRMVGGSAANDVVTGGAGADVLIGFDGADTLYGGGGNDILYGGTDGLVPNGDLLDGQSGADTYHIDFLDTASDSGTDGALDVYNINGGSFNDADGFYDGAALINGLGLPSLPFQQMQSKGALALITAQTTAQSAPTLADYIQAGIVQFEMSADGHRALTLTETGAVLFTEQNANWGDGGFDLDIGRQDQSARGGDGRDIMIADWNGDLMLGLDGNDHLIGRWGDDELSGGQGNDWLSGSFGADSVYGDRGDDALFGGFGDDSLWGGSGDDWMHAGRGDDNLSGGLGADSLWGGSGSDTLRGNGGDDRLHGGRGADTFVFASNGGADLVTDFRQRHGDQVLFDVDGIASFADLLDTASQQGRNVVFDFDDGDSLTLRHTDLDDLSSSDLILA